MLGLYFLKAIYYHMEVFMLGAYLRATLFGSLLLSSLFIAINVNAQEPQNTTTTVTTTTSPTGTVTERRTIVTTAPAPKETIVTPTGYTYCFTVKAGWYLDVWVSEHSVCQYPNSPEGVLWVEGYWVCNQYDLNEGKCTSWDWKSAHWEKNVNVY